LLNFSLDLQEKAENSSISVLKIMSSKNVCALEFACIFGRNAQLLLLIFSIEGRQQIPKLKDNCWHDPHQKKKHVKDK